jgi:hypothetical protein
MLFIGYRLFPYQMSMRLRRTLRHENRGEFFLEGTSSPQTPLFSR